MSLTDTYTLSNDTKIPALGYGTWQVTNPEEAIQGVVDAVNEGYRHIDTAQMYKNEEYIGQGIKKCGVPRNELFVTSKLNNTNHGYDKARQTILESLEKLDLDYLDLFLIHWPVVKDTDLDWQQDNIDTWRALEDLYDEGKLKAIGVSNFAVPHLKNIVENCRIKPMVNQIRLHPGVLQKDTVEMSHNENMIVEAWSPLSPLKHMKEDAKVQTMCTEYGKSIAQILLRWSLQHGYVTLTKSVHEERIKENADIFDFELSTEDMKYLDGLEFEDLDKPDDFEKR
ncbi:MAG: aldo/keto reductase [Alkalibacterium sp.]|uniref:Aldo/keto reductase n=1 Tax=Alkalibacterium gilvum TaxID=1130080 RepID=A0A1H6UAD7_9LACT|nr:MULTISPECIES: aldo/keto reductase [Alkalibacterium]MDN6193978.1 aldo/keto reductase [Alkalibacterium sp.]MDN6293677.1 aldo/keto reductase [Alkalibacterium sp.]MDN6295393.1 aldo/keto reductase [Alkalibacterium sp.]MDN6327701.1 aldo/keto reductase [Alkalibacterium sp.]MDN6398810.1 aldo/keto reductase [Alkalibacterium sp.]